MSHTPHPLKGLTLTDLALAAHTEDAAAEGDEAGLLDSTKTSSPRSDSFDTRFVAVILRKDATEVEVSYLYRGDARAPDTIFEEGFKAKGTNTNLVEHAIPVPYKVKIDYVEPDPSGYVSTSISKESAKNFPPSTKTGFLYEINPQKDGIDILKKIGKEVAAGRVAERDFNVLKAEKEIAIRSFIQPQDIKGVWTINVLKQDGTWTHVVDPSSFVANEHYEPYLSPTYQKISKAVKVAGVAATAVGGAIDGFKLYKSFEQSQNSGNFSTFFNEGARVISAWGSATALGASLGTEGAALGGAVGGPFGALIGGAIGSVGGSILGYLGGEALVAKINDTMAGSGAGSIGEMIQTATNSLPDETLMGATSTDIALMAHAADTTKVKKKKEKVDQPLHPGPAAPKPPLPPKPPTKPHPLAKKAKDLACDPVEAASSLKKTTPKPQPNYNALARSQTLDTYFAHQFGAPHYSMFDNLALSLGASLSNTFSPYSALMSLVNDSLQKTTFWRSQPSTFSAYSIMQTLIYGQPKILSFQSSDVTNPILTYCSSNEVTSPSPFGSYIATRPELSFGAQAFGPFKSLSYGASLSNYTYSVTQVENAFKMAMNMSSSNDGAYDIYQAMSLYLSMSTIGEYKVEFSYRSFVNLLRNTNLINSYNNTHGSLQSMRIISRMMREIGGVAVNVGILKGLRNSVEDVLCEQAFISMRLRHGDMPIPVEQLRQIIRELAQGILVHKAYPFFSLHFNRDHELYPVLHPAYQQTLVGEICGFLDYFMKGFLNGGIYSAEFLRHWHKTRNKDREYLKQNLVDIKALAKEAGIPYLSLRELIYRAGLQDYINEKTFRTSFRIIAEQGKIHQLGHVFSVAPNFKIEHSIDLTPEYEEYLRAEAQKEQDPKHPYVSNVRKQHARLVRTYQQMALMIKEIMPILPMFSQSFQSLGIISFLSYYITTLNDMGRQLDLTPVPKLDTELFPPVLPAIPVRFYQFYPVHLSFAELLDALGTADSPSRLAFDDYCRQLANHERPPFPEVVKTIIKDYLQAQLPATTALDEDYLTAVCINIMIKLSQITQAIHISIVKELNNLSEALLLEGPPFEDLDEEFSLVEEKAARLSLLLQEKKTLTEIKQLEKKQDLTALYKEIEDENVASLHQQLAEVKAKPVPAGYARDDAKLMEYFNQQLTELKTKIATDLAEAIATLNQNWEHNTGLLQSIIDDYVSTCHHFGQFILKHRQLGLMDVTKQRYEHSTLDIADRDYYEACGDNLAIIGGCGVDLASTTPLPLAKERVADLLSPEVMAAENEYFVFSESANQPRATMKLPIRFQPVSDWTEQAELLMNTLTTSTSHDPHGRYPIHFAVEMADTLAVKSLLASDPLCLEMKTATHLTPLMLAAQSGHTGIVCLLLSKGANPDHALPNGLTALSLAAQSGFEETALAIIENSELNINAINAINEDDVNILHLALDLGYERLALAAIERGVDVLLGRKTDGLTPLHYAAKEGKLSIIEKLVLIAGLQLTTPLPSGETVLHQAVQSGNLALVEQLLKAEPALLLIADCNGETPLMHAICWTQHSIALLLIESYPEDSPDINAQNASGQTALILAAKTGAYRVTKTLLEELPQVDVTLKDIQGLTAAYHLLCQGAFFHYQNLHRKAKVNIDDEFHGKSSLAIALAHGHLLLADYLIAEGARYDTSSQADEKVLEYFVKYDHLPALQTYLKKQGRWTISLEACLSLAAESGSEACYAYLIGLDELAVIERLETIPKIMRQSSVKNLDCLMKEVHLYYQYADASELGEFAHCAVQFGNIAMISHLPQYGVSFVTKNEAGLTSLHLAIQADDVEMLKLLLTHVKQEDLPSDLQSYAFRLEKPACEKYLRKHNKAQQALSVENDTVFIAACEAGNAAKVERLLPHYIHLKNSPNPMIAAIHRGHYFVVKLLLEHGFAAHGFPGEALHALQLNAKHDQVEMIALLLQKGFSPEPGYYLVPNLFTRNAVYRGNFVGYHAAKEELLKALKSANIRTIKKIIVEQKFPIDSALFLFQGKLRPFLHCAFMRHYEAAIALVSKRVDPLRKAEGGIPLIDVILDYHSQEEEENEKLAWIKQYFPEQAKSILTQTDDNCPEVTAVAKAINLDNTNLVMQLLKAGFPRNDLGNHQQSALHLAAAKGAMDLVQALWTSDLDINLPDARARTPLMMAASMGQIGMMRWLIQHGANPDLSDRYGNLALHMAISMKEDEAALYLFDYTRAIDHPNRYGESPFLLAVQSGLHSVVDYCLRRRGIDLHRVNDQGDTALSLAVLQLPILKILIDSTAHYTPAEFQKALRSAAAKGSVSAFTYLADYGIRIDELDEKEHCAMMIALVGGNEDMVRALRQYTAFYQPHLQINMLLAAVQNNRLFAIREMLLMGVDVNGQHKFGLTALAIAAQHDAIQSAQLLLQQHADPHITCINGWTPLHYAAQKGSLGVARLLLAHHARLDALNLEGKTPIDIANTYQQEAMIRLFSLEPPQGEMLPLRYTSSQVAKQSDLVSILKSLLDNDDVSTIFRLVSNQSLELCLLSLQEVEESQQKSLILQWAQWLQSLPAETLAKLDHALLSKYPWNSVMGEPLMDLLQHAHLDYFWDYIEPIKIVRLEKAEFAAHLARYQEFSKELEFPIQSKFPLLPLQRGISFTVDNGEYLERMIFALKTTFLHQLQLKYLSELPSIEVMKEAKCSGIWFFCRDSLNPPDTEWATKLAEGGDGRTTLDYNLAWQAYSAAMHYQYLKTQRLSSEEIDYIYRSHYPILAEAHDPRYAILFLTYAAQIRDRLGYPIFRAFFERLLSASVPGEEKIFLDVFQSMLALEGEADLLAILADSRSKNNIYYFDDLLKQEEAALLARRFPEQPLAEVIKAFRAVKDPLSEDELSRIEETYPLLEKTYELYRQTSPEARLEAMRARADALRTDAFNLALRCELFALLSIAVQHHYNKKPYRTQLVALLALTEPELGCKGRIAEILTGEGKTLVLTMLIAFYALQGEKIDMISSSNNLVCRDQHENEAFFKSLGITTGVLCHQEVEPAHFKPQVIYGTSTDFEFPLLRQMLFGEILRGDRSYDRAIVDEVDHLFISLGLTPAILAMPAARDMSFVYKPIFDYVQAAASKSISALELKTHLLTLTTGKEAELIYSLEESLFLRWISSAMQALVYEEKVDYIVKNGEIVIMDIGTGRESQGTRWQHGIHAFVETKHGITPRAESLTAASISHPAFFAEYQKISGVTGTMGLPVEREEIKTLYGIRSFDVAAHRSSQRIQLDTQFTLTKEAHWGGLLAQAKAATKRNQAVLILFSTIKNSEMFSAYLKTKNRPHTILNTQQQEDEDFLIALAGVEGQITIATNTAGRGVDIKTKSLHVIFADFPENTRDLAQGFGRAGRQGQPGSCELFLWRDDPMVKKLMPIDPLRHQLPNLALDLIIRGKRDELVERLSAQRIKSAGLVSLQYELLKRFCALIRPHAEHLKTLRLDEFISQLSQVNHFIVRNPYFKDNRILKPVLSRLSRFVRGEPSSLVDQTILFEQLKEIYLLVLSQIWGEFLSQLNHDKSQKTDIEDYRKHCETQFTAFIEGDLSVYISPDSRGFFNFIQQLRAELSSSVSLAVARQRFGFIKTDGAIITENPLRQEIYQNTFNI